MSDNKIMFPHVIDSTMLAALRSCPQKMYRSYMQHWKPKADSVHLVAGGAFASGLEAARRAFFVDGQSHEEAEAAGMIALIKHYGDFECPADSAKSLERMCGALAYYFEQYRMGEDGMTPIKLADGSQGIEFSFAVPLPVMHPVTGIPLIFAGRADLIAEFAGGVYLEDDKTTKSLGQSWARQWEMRGQFTGYAWAARESGIHTDGTIVRGVSILKTKYETMSVITYRPDWEIDRWLKQTCRDLERLKLMWQEGYYDYALDGACGEYGGCPMQITCKSKEPEAWFPLYFQQRVWDPIGRTEMGVKEWEDSWDHTGKSACVTSE